MGNAGVHPTGGLADALGLCGVNYEEVKLERDELCQEDVLTFSATDLSDEVLTLLADLYLSFPSRFVFSSDELEDAFERIVSQSPRMVALREQAANQQRAWLETQGLLNFPPFDPEIESLGNFAARVESACGVERGDLLSIGDDGGISINPKEPTKLTSDATKTLIALLESFSRNLPISVTGRIQAMPANSEPALFSDNPGKSA